MNNAKNIFLVIFVMVLTYASSLDAQRKDTTDYFAIGALFGNYDPHSSMHGSEVVNSAGLEVEYYKFSDLSFFLQGLYKFTGNDMHMRPRPSEMEQQGLPGPYNGDGQILGVSFGGRYFLRAQNFNPFLELGINQEFRIGDEHRPPMNVYDNTFIPLSRPENSYNLSLGIGAGLSIKVDPKFKLEMKYDLYKSLLSGRGGAGYSILAGAKYNL